MTDDMRVVLEDLDRLKAVVTDVVGPVVQRTEQAAPGTRVPDGAHTLLLLGPAGDRVTNGIADRLEATMAEFRQRFDEMVDKLQQTRTDYEQSEQANVDATAGVRTDGMDI